MIGHIVRDGSDPFRSTGEGHLKALEGYWVHSHIAVGATGSSECWLMSQVHFLCPQVGYIFDRFG